jgi:hypothetical protein
MDNIAYGLLYVMKWISSSEVVLILVSIPFWTCLFGLGLLDEHLSPYTALGAFFIVCGIAVYAIFPPIAPSAETIAPAADTEVSVDIVLANDTCTSTTHTAATAHAAII